MAVTNINASPRLGRALRRAVGFLVVSIWLSAALSGGEIIDRILAVVGGEILLLTDVHAAVRFGLIEPLPGAQDPTSSALNALIDRQLQLFEVNRFLPPEPAAAAIDERLAEIRKRFPSDTALQAALAEVGITEAQLRSRIRDNLRIDSYRAQRFGAALQPTEEDLLRYYRSHETDFTKEGVLQPFSVVQNEVRARVIRDRSTTLIREWLETLRRRTDVQVLYSQRVGNRGFRCGYFTAKILISGPGCVSLGEKRTSSRLCSKRRMYAA
jgi:hypothetical protein